MEKVMSRFVMCRGVKTHYWEADGDGPVVIALHCGGAGSSGMAGMGPLLPRLGGSARVIAPDSIGGFGQTDPYAPAPYGLLSRVDHTADFIDTLCLPKVTLVGNSQGAWTAVQYAVRHPDRVEKIILISSLTIANSLNIKQRPTDALKALNDYDGTREGMQRILKALVIDPARITDKLIDDRQAAANRPGALESFRAFGKATFALRDNPLLSIQNDMTRSLPALVKTIPTIFIWGDADTFALPETGREIARFVPDAPFHWVPGAGHQVQTDKPDETAKIIREFMGL